MLSLEDYQAYQNFFTISSFFYFVIIFSYLQVIGSFLSFSYLKFRNAKYCIEVNSKITSREVKMSC